MAKWIRMLFSKEFALFSIIGLAMTFVNLYLFYAFNEYISMNYLLSNIISYLIAVVISYFLNVMITFSEHKTLREFFLGLFQFLGMKLFLLGIDSCLLYSMVSLMGMDKYISKILLTVLLTTVSYFLSKRIIKKHT